MFVDLKTVSAFKTRIVIVTYEGTEIPAENKHIAPFGPWRMKIVSMKKANEGSSSLDNFLNSFYKIKIRNSDEAYKDIAGIRVYKCTVQNDCLLMGKSD